MTDAYNLTRMELQILCALRHNDATSNPDGLVTSAIAVVCRHRLNDPIDARLGDIDWAVRELSRSTDLIRCYRPEQGQHRRYRLSKRGQEYLRDRGIS